MFTREHDSPSMFARIRRDNKTFPEPSGLLSDRNESIVEREDAGARFSFMFIGCHGDWPFFFSNRCNFR